MDELPIEQQTSNIMSSFHCFGFCEEKLGLHLWSAKALAEPVAGTFILPDDHHTGRDKRSIAAATVR